MAPMSSFCTIIASGLALLYLLWQHLYLAIAILTMVAFVGISRMIIKQNFDYPVEACSDRSLNDRQYYIKSESLFHSKFILDNDGVVQNDYGKKIGVQYNPAYVAWYGLTNLNQYISTGEQEFLKRFQNQVKWVCDNYKDWGERGFVWPYEFSWQENRAYLKAPWASAMAQGLVISLLTRAYKLDGDDSLLHIAKQATKIFKFDVNDGGIRSHKCGNCLYEEYPAFPLAHILDGFIFALLGLYDLYALTRDQEVKELFDAGAAGLLINLEYWNYRNKWSWYGSHGYLSPNQYNKLNLVLLHVMHKITGDERFLQKAQCWDSTRLSIFGKIEIWCIRNSTLYFLIIKRILRKVRHYVWYSCCSQSR